MNVSWSKYRDELLKRLPELRETLNGGASDEDIRAVEEKMGIVFPDGLRTLYLENNGDTGDAMCGMILGFHFLTLDELYSEWNDWKDIIEKWATEDISDSAVYSSDPPGYVKTRYADLFWLPICEDGSGNHIGIDLDPDVNGKVGQVINFGRDENRKTVLADSLGAFFERLTRIINSKDFYIGEIEGENVVLLGSDDEEEGSHLTDYLLKKESVK